MGLRGRFTIACLCALGGCRGTDDWDRFAKLRLECNVAEAKHLCKHGPPLARRTCLLNQARAMKAPPCSDFHQLYQRLLAAKHEGAWTIFRSGCADEAPCPKDPGATIASVIDKQLDESIKELDQAVAAMQKFEARQPKGFYDATWGATPRRTAEVVIENLRRGKDDELGWRELQDIATSKVTTVKYVKVTNDKGDIWRFRFEADKLAEYSRTVPKAGAAEIAVLCRELFGTPTGKGEEADSLLWEGSISTVLCGFIPVTKTYRGGMVSVQPTRAAPRPSWP
jgi:hypothetical protein